VKRQDAKDAKDARELQGAGGETDEVASAVLQAAIDVHRGLKTVEQLAPIHIAQALSYLRATELALALVINFNVTVLLRGVRRVVLSVPSYL
jgi:hypothetical protein